MLVFILHAVLETDENSHLSEIHQLLQYVEKQFSDILLLEEVVTKQEFIGKGIHIAAL